MKKFLSLILTLAMALSLVACGGSEKEEAPAQSGSAPAQTETKTESAAPEYEWTLAHHLAEESQQHKGFVAFADEVFEKSGGRIKINIAFGASLGSQREAIEQVNLGTIAMAMGEASLYANYCPELGVLNLPFLFETEEQYLEVIETGVGDKLDSILAENTNMVNLAWLCGGTRDIYSSKPVTAIGDIAGLKIRTPESPVFVQSFEALGANPTPIAANEMYTALQQGVVDAMEGSLETGYSYKIYEVAKNCLKTNHILAGISLVINKGIYNDLPDDLKAVLDECCANMTVNECKLVADSSDYYQDLLTKEGVVFTEMSAEEQANAKAAVADFTASYIGDNAVMQEIYDEIVAATK